MVTRWNYDNLQEWIKNDCDKIIGEQIIDLDISDNDLRKIPKEIFKLTQLETFNCNGNQIKKIPKEIKHLIKLERFECSGNQIKNIPKEIKHLIKLEDFECIGNQIKKIPKKLCNLINLNTFMCGGNNIKKIPKEINNLKNLKIFYCNDNKIKKITKEICENIHLVDLDCSKNEIKKISKEIDKLIHLSEFQCSENKIRNIPKEICNLFNLKHFHCPYNKIRNIPKEIGNLTQLETFYCYNNEITTIPIEITNCRYLNKFSFDNNEIDYIQPQIRRWLNRFKHEQQIYSDTQSVHNHAIQEGVSKSINYITSIKPTIQICQLQKLIIENPYLEERVKCLLFEYIDNKEVHTILNITFEELLLSVYDFIEKNENKEELYKIMNVEMSEANCKCFTGRISRLINVLNGFDEHIEIHIADNEQIGNIISIIRNNFDEDDENEFKRRVKEELTMRAYSEEIINEWINNI